MLMRQNFDRQKDLSSRKRPPPVSSCKLPPRLGISGGRLRESSTVFFLVCIRLKFDKQVSRKDYSVAIHDLDSTSLFYILLNVFQD